MKIERNGVTLDFLPEEIKRGERSGKRFFMPPREVSVTDLDNWLGAETRKEKQLAFLRLTSQAAVKKLTEKDGKTIKELDETQFAKIMSELSVRGESMADLEERRDELMDDMFKLQEAAATNPTENVPKIFKLMDEIKLINEDINERKREREQKKEEKQANGEPAAVPAAA